jgi:hypothetical protein
VKHHHVDCVCVKLMGVHHELLNLAHITSDRKLKNIGEVHSGTCQLACKLKILLNKLNFFVTVNNSLLSSLFN